MAKHIGELIGEGHVTGVKTNTVTVRFTDVSSKTDYDMSVPRTYFSAEIEPGVTFRLYGMNKKPHLVFEEFVALPLTQKDLERIKTYGKALNAVI